jgi:phenylpropionate dioxygenase-like ring-hydroxylating dioxygenase large terminal subunit
MLSSSQNDLLTRTDPDTPCGNLMRRYWQPVALSRELLPGEPLPVKILGEDLVLFEDDQGRIGLIDRLCPHRGVDLSYGRVEDGGLRCIYHGWLFAHNGQCLAQPGEPAGRDFADRIKQKSYPCRRAGGLILTYMGPGEPPPLPAFPFFGAEDDERVWTTKLHHECNYLQASEGNVDPQHLSYLHRFVTDGAAILPELNRLLVAGGAPKLLTKETSFGLEILAIRELPSGDRYVRITNFIMPNSSSFDGVPLVDKSKEPLVDNMGYQIHWHVPIDDYSHWKYTILFRYQGKIDRAFQEAQHANIDAEFRTPGRLHNRFLQDRQEMRVSSYAGMGRKYYDHDKFATEIQGPIADRTREHLGESDKPILAMRRQIVQGIKDVEAGKVPMFAGPEGSASVRDILVKVGISPAGADLNGQWWREPATQS